MNPEISRTIAALTSDPETFAAIADIYQQGRRDGIEEAGEVAAFLLEREADFDPNVLRIPTQDLELDGVRAYNLLRRNNVNTIWELIRMGESGLRGIRNFKDSDLESIKTALAHYGLSLGA